ncbi:GNAT family N-acetyltransferase [Marivita geojedonensis]|uniref:GNAT family N-acetyltransferase n=1 Tax=Marivita geojedonensis TaxID=1123756 RepID=UPI000D46EE30|nr:GNAT family N-acetyltransferase [Marivita geojedonensis]PRY77969.1 acetyltransferase (GNAT) family protein [Marivita geojedonensis]
MLGGEIQEMFVPNSNHHDAAIGAARLVSYQRADDVPMEAARALLTAHVTWAYDKFRDLGAPEFDVMQHVEYFFSNFDAVLPPKGAYFLAHDAEGGAVGTGSLRRVSDDVAEMKHLYVHPSYRGTGLGAALIEARIGAAREFGVSELVADTFRGNTPMISLYHRLGFSDAEPYDSAVATITPELIPHLRYFQMTL